MHLFFKSPNKKKRARGIHAKKRTRLQSWSEYIWPSMGWQPFLRWLEIKIKRTKAAQDSIAMGAAVGIFVTFIPFMGLQVVLMWLLCKLVRGHFAVSVLVSLIGNPWTFPVIWFVSHQLGMMILLREHTTFPDEISISHVMNHMDYYWDMFLLPTTVGGLPLGLSCAFVTYYIIHWHIKSYHKARAAYLSRRRAEEKEKRRLRDIAKTVAIGAGEKLKSSASSMIPKRKEDEEET